MILTTILKNIQIPYVNYLHKSRQFLKGKGSKGNLSLKLRRILCHNLQMKLCLPSTVVKTKQSKNGEITHVCFPSSVLYPQACFCQFTNTSEIFHY